MVMWPRRGRARPGGHASCPPAIVTGSTGTPTDTARRNAPSLKRPTSPVRLRSPYVDALSLLQLRALRGIRATTAEKDPTDADHRLMLLTVNGVAAGLQNTG